MMRFTGSANPGSWAKARWRLLAERALFTFFGVEVWILVIGPLYQYVLPYYAVQVLIIDCTAVRRIRGNRPMRHTVQKPDTFDIIILTTYAFSDCTANRHQDFYPRYSPDSRSVSTISSFWAGLATCWKRSWPYLGPNTVGVDWCP